MKVTGIEVDGKMYDPVRAVEYDSDNKGYCGSCAFAEKDIGECVHLCRSAEHGTDDAMILKERKRCVSGVNIDAIVRHYLHAKEKHPHFCDIITCLSDVGADTHLDIYRSTLAAEVESNCVEVGTILMCEFYEAIQAYTHGDTAHSIEECYDAIAVLLRVIDKLKAYEINETED